MSVKVSNGWCKSCQRAVMAQGNGPTHLLHVVLSVISAGFWLPIWLLVSLSSIDYRCTTCGSRVGQPPKTKSTPPPLPRLGP